MDFHDQPLPYVFFGDVVDWAKSNLPTADEPTRRRFAMALNTLSASDNRDVWNVVGVSFFEPLVRGDEQSDEHSMRFDRGSAEARSKTCPRSS